MSVRDLDAEGVLNNPLPAVAWSVDVQDAFKKAGDQIRMQRMEERLGRLEEVVANLMQKQGVVI